MLGKIALEVIIATIMRHNGLGYEQVWVASCERVHQKDFEDMRAGWFSTEAAVAS